MYSILYIAYCKVYCRVYCRVYVIDITIKR